MDSSIGELARAIASAFARVKGPLDWQGLRERLTRAAAAQSRDDAIATLADVTRSLTLAADRREATIVLIVDQLEEALDRAGAVDIEGPAARAGLRLEPGLVGRLVGDTGNSDALPLLAFTLRELSEECRTDGPLTLAAYERLGGLAGAVAERASAVVGAALSAKSEEALHDSFPSMAKIGEEGQVTAETTKDVPKEGRIGLQIHAGEAWSAGIKVRFRNIRLTEL